MDRHDVSELVTAENVAQLHKEDLKIQEEFNCRGLTYWFDDIKKIAFCLIDAPDKESLHQMHKHAHGEVPNQILEVDVNLVESFLGRIKDPENEHHKNQIAINDPAQRTLLVIRFNVISLKDIRISELDSKIQQAIHTISNILNRFGGRLVNQSKSYLLVSFQSVTNAVLCAFESNKLQSELKQGFGKLNVEIRMGLATGMPVNKNKAFFEDTIKMADAFCLTAKKNILVSNEIKNVFISENTGKASLTNNLHSLSLADEDFLNQLMDFIGKEWQNADLKVDDFGKSLGMSKTLMYRKMIALTGKSPSNFVKEYRLQSALERVNLKVSTISEIAYETGFNNPTYFSKCFQKRFGILPSVYIKS